MFLETDHNYNINKRFGNHNICIMENIGIDSLFVFFYCYLIAVRCSTIFGNFQYYYLFSALLDPILFEKEKGK